jgi:hypothetical protein
MDAFGCLKRGTSRVGQIGGSPCLEKNASYPSGCVDTAKRRPSFKGCKAGGSRPTSSLLEKHCFSNRITRTLLGGYRTSGCLSSGITTPSNLWRSNHGNGTSQGLGELSHRSGFRGWLARRSFLTEPEATLHIVTWTWRDPIGPSFFSMHASPVRLLSSRSGNIKFGGDHYWHLRLREIQPLSTRNSPT